MWVLVVDDDPEVRRLVRRGLEREGVQVAEAEDGPAALTLLDDLTVDVAVLDRGLPGMPGLELLAEVRRRDPGIHVIMLTGAAAEADRVLGLVSGADDYVVKPFSARELAARVVAARRRQQARAPAAIDSRPASRGMTTRVDARPRTQQHRPSEEGEAVVVLDRDVRIQSMNPAAERLYGWSDLEVRGRPLADVIGRAMAPHDLAAVRETLHSFGHWHGEVDHHRRDGSRIRVRSSSTVLRHGSGESTGVVLVSRALGDATHVVAPVAAPAATTDADDDLDADIRRGLDDQEFVVHYQPVVRLSDASVVGVEALARWQHPTRGLLAPAAFIDAAERSGAISDIDAFVLDAARAQWAQWRDAGRQVYVAVNISGRQLADATLSDRIADRPLPEGQLWLEVTETSLVNDLDQAARTLDKITALGVKVSIDDFGTGWASMSYLREFPVHALKIDRTFVHGVGTSSVDTAIATSVLSLGRELGLKVFAEGIETHGQHDQLRDLGCEFGQGYRFGRPVAPGELDVRNQ